jgi:hypothetical protein
VVSSFGLEGEGGMEYVRVWGAWLKGSGSGSGEGGGDESCEGEE